VSLLITSIKDEALMEGIEESWYEVWKMLTSTPWGKVEEDEHMKRVYTGFIDGVLVTRLEEDRVDEKIEKAKCFFSNLSRRWTWPIYTSTRPLNLGGYLERHGLRRVEEKHPLMATNLDVLEDVPVPDGLEIRKVVDKATLPVWSRVFLVGHGLERLLESGSRTFQSVGVEDGQPVAKYLGFYNGVPVASSQVFYGKRVARLNFVSTMPEARGKGIGSAISRASLLSARDLGYKVAVLTATEMGYPIYRRLGFDEIGNWDYYIHED
jgi:GNAT superfamily N-acetyltransferase